MSYTLKSLINKRNKGFVALLNSGLPSFTKFQNQCFKCVLKPLKPHRSYHCSVCERDIIYMDHHCFLVNNCIGLYNYRYYLLMILYGTVTVLLMLMTFLMQPQGPTLLMSNKDANESSSGNLQSLREVDRICFTILYRLDIFLAIVSVPWTIWNWRLAF